MGITTMINEMHAKTNDRKRSKMAAAEAKAFDEGKAAGIAGTNRNDNPFRAMMKTDLNTGMVLSTAFWMGWDLGEFERAVMTPEPPTKADEASRILQIEREVGERAVFHIYHRSPKGKFYVDGLFKGNAATEEKARAFLLSVHRKNTILRVVVPTGAL